MRQELQSNYAEPGGREPNIEPVVLTAEQPHLEDPRVVLSLLEADQVVAAKRQMRFGPQKLSRGVRVILWILRIYVVVMMVIVLISVLRAVHVAH